MYIENHVFNFMTPEKYFFQYKLLLSLVLVLNCKIVNLIF